MGIVGLLISRGVRFLSDGLNGPTNEEARELLETKLGECERTRADLERRFHTTATSEEKLYHEALDLRARVAKAERDRDRNGWRAVEFADMARLALHFGLAECERLRAESKGLRFERDRARTERDSAELERDNIRAELKTESARLRRENRSTAVLDAKDRAERHACLVARAVELGADVVMAPENGKWGVEVFDNSELSPMRERDVPAADVPAVLSRMLDEVAQRKGGA